MANSCSVIIPTYDRAELVAHTLESLTRQAFPADRLEVLVVDDGSTDGTSSVVDRYRDRLALRYVFLPDEGYRVARARNVGIRRARGDVCVLLDAGVVAHSGLVARHVACHEGAARRAVCGYVYGFAEPGSDVSALRSVVDPRDVDRAIERFAASGEWPDRREPFYRRHQDDLSRLPAPWVVFWTCNVSVRREELLGAGLFDERFRSWGGEDVDLGYRLFRRGLDFLVCRGASAVHWPHSATEAENGDSLRENYRYLAQKYDDPVLDLLGTVRLTRLNDVLTGGRDGTEGPPAAHG